MIVENKNLIQLAFIGLFIGSWAAGLSDSFGRKTLILTAMGISCVSSLLQALVPSYPAFVILRILVQVSEIFGSKISSNPLKIFIPKKFSFLKNFRTQKT